MFNVNTGNLSVIYSKTKSTINPHSSFVLFIKKHKTYIVQYCSQFTNIIYNKKHRVWYQWYPNMTTF